MQGSAESDTEHSQAFRKGLNEAGFTDGRNVAIEYRWANFQEDRLPGLVGDLGAPPSGGDRRDRNLGTVLAVKQAAATIPIVFNSGIDPVKAGLVAALNKPGGNITGITTLNTQVGTKRVGLMHELLPSATRFALLVNREDPANVMDMITGAQGAAAALGLQIDSRLRQQRQRHETALADVVQKRASGLIITPGDLFHPASCPDCDAGGARRHACDLCQSHFSGSRRADELRIGLDRYFPPGRRLLRPHSQGRETGRPAGLAADQVPSCHQSEHRQGARRLQIPPTLLALADEVIE